MNFIGSLRGQITMAFFLAAVGLSTVLLLTVDFFASDMEDAYLSVHLTENMNLLLEQAHGKADFRLPYSATMRGYSFVRGRREPAPSGLSDLAPGYQELKVGGRELHALVVDEGDVRYILTYDGEPLEAIERTLTVWLVLGVAVMGVIVTGLGYWMSAQIARPITELADSIEALKGEAALLAMNSGRSGSDEVARLSRAFRNYSLRLSEFIARERTFTADVSHELRNPVMAAKSAVELLEARDDLQPKAVGQIARIRRAVDRMQELIELFLSLSREPQSSAAANGTIPAAFDVVAVAESVFERYRDAARLKGLMLNLVVRAHPEGRGDSSMAQVVLDNVVANAVRYTLTGSVDVIVDIDGVLIADSGPGIAESERRTVLERLERGAVGRASSGAGFGLGLSIVKRICEHQGWAFDLQSVAHEGTRVLLSFGRRVAAQDID